jgi:hypothetical protein
MHNHPLLTYPAKDRCKDSARIFGLATEVPLSQDKRGSHTKRRDFQVEEGELPHFTTCGIPLFHRGIMCARPKLPYLLTSAGTTNGRQ